jgi:hypothetical protein
MGNVSTRFLGSLFCYFPIKKRLQRLFVSSKTASLTRWHDEHQRKDDLLRHPVDSPLWTNFDENIQNLLMIVVISA